jgi:hypothetical protein
MNSGILHQDLGTMVSGQTYTFDISYGWRSDLSSDLDSKQFAFIIRPSITSATAFAIDKSLNFTEGAPPAGSTNGLALPTPGALTHAFLSYTATPADDGQPLTIQLQASDLQLLVDQVKLTTTVPEPASLSFIGLAGAGLLARRRSA